MSRGPGSFAPLAAGAFLAIAIGTDLWRGDPPPLEPPPVHVPALPLLAPFALDATVRDPFYGVAERVPDRALAARRRVTVPPAEPPLFSGVVTIDGRTYAVTPDGLVGPGGQLGDWIVKTVTAEELVVEAAGKVLHMQAAGSAPRDEEPR